MVCRGFSSICKLFCVLALSLGSERHGAEAAELRLETKSKLGIWIDPATPSNRQVYTSSRGDPWELVMSDEFNTPGRSFKPGEDHMWTSIDKPDGVNAALEVYSHNMTSTKCDSDGTCYLYIKAQDEVTNVTVWNAYQNPPGHKNVTFFYRAGMVQSWNKFCFQGGMVEVAAQLPGAISRDTGNPDTKRREPRAHAASIRYYPTWPGIWMMGNLGRAVFSASTNRMWPFSYNECDDKVFLSTNQRISACDANPGHGMNPNQGRGAPEIDLIEGGGVEISSSMQIGPGMPPSFRIEPPVNDPNPLCVYTSTCSTPGANTPDIPTAVYAAKRGHKSWYQSMKYAANNACLPDAALKQDYATVRAALDNGVSDNTCSLATCPASRDPNADLSLMRRTSASSQGNTTSDRWSINSNGTCFPLMNGYTGGYLCSPGNPSKLCEKSDVPQSDKVQAFEYQMDALSANWPIHVAAYTSYLVYQVEWVMGPNGYIRWMLAGQPLFEIPASALTNPPQDDAKSNPVKIMIEEPMYLIFNVALSGTWGTQPPNAGKACRGDGSDPVTNKICDAFPMFLKIDYIRVYQDTTSPLNSTVGVKARAMHVGCDPRSHPTREWIDSHLDEYQDAANQVVEVAGKAFCRDDADCTIGSLAASRTAPTRTGSCVQGRCKCTAGHTWTGPRCTTPMRTSTSTSTSSKTAHRSFGPPLVVAVSTAIAAVLATLAVVCVAMHRERQEALGAMQKQKQEKQRAAAAVAVVPGA